MKQRDEIHYWRRFKNTRGEEDPPTLLEISEELEIDYKRAEYIAHKWSKKEFINYGVGWRVAWITPRGMSAEISVDGFTWDEDADGEIPHEINL